MYSDEKKKIALNLLKETKSVTKTIRILGYPTKVQLYAWVKSQNELPKSRKQLALIGNPPEHPRNPSMETKLNALKRCFEKGENIRAVSEDIGYSRNSIYKWRKRYLKEGTLGLMNNKSILSGELNTAILHFLQVLLVSSKLLNIYAKKDIFDIFSLTLLSPTCILPLHLTVKISI